MKDQYGPDYDRSRFGHDQYGHGHDRYLLQTSRLIAMINDALHLPNNAMIEENESLVEIAVCDATDMTPDRWATLNEAARVPWIEEAVRVQSSKKTTTPSGETKQGGDKSEASLDARALAVFIEHSDWTKVKIASHLGCNSRSLAPKRCPKLDAAKRAYEATVDPTRRIIRGSKSVEGELEAWEDR